MTKQSILLLEAFGNIGETLVDAIRSEGYTVVVATHRDIYDERYSARLRDAVDVPVFVDYAAETITDDLVAVGREHHAVGVVTGWEFFTALTSAVADRLGLPGNNPALGTAARNKWQMAQVLHDAGVNHAVTVRADDLDDLARQIDSQGLEYPLVVKPAENAGSVGVRVVDDPFELPAAVKEAQAWPMEFPHDIPLDNSVLAQSYVGGCEYSIETLAVDGEIRHLAVTEKATTQGAFRAETGHTVPASLDERASGLLLDETTKALHALGFRSGAAHTEAKLWNGRPWIIECGLRPAGDHIVKLVTLALGVDYAKAYVRAAAVGGELPPVGPAQRYAGVRFVTPERNGTVVAAPALPPQPGIVESGVLVTEGDTVGGIANNISRLAYLIGTAENRQGLDDRLEAAAGNIGVVIE
jgi:biotin carboxylase